MSPRALAAEKLLAELAAGGPPPDGSAAEVLEAAEALISQRRLILDELGTLDEAEREALRARPGVAQLYDRFHALTSDWQRALERARSSASARVAAVRAFRQNRSQR